MKLIIGLGNPTEKHLDTRHNAGFVVLDEIQKTWNFPEFQFNKKFNAKISEGTFGGEKIILAKPETFMNLSGKAAGAIAQYFKIEIENITIIHDELDIDLGAFKVSSDSSAGGHNGVQSVFDEFGTQKIKRIRVGIEGCEKKKERIIPGDVFVLQSFSDDELQTVKNLSQEIAKVL